MLQNNRKNLTVMLKKEVANKERLQLTRIYGEADLMKNIETFDFITLGLLPL